MRSIFDRARLAIRQLTPPVRRLLLHSMLFGLALSIAELLFNFYLVSLGYNTDTAGLLSTISRLSGVVLGFPIGMLIDRIGARQALIFGALCYGGSWALLLTSGSIWILSIAQFLIGGSHILAVTAAVPLLASITSDAQRAAFFGLNASAVLMIGLLGNLTGGLLPSMAGRLLNTLPESTNAYRLALSIIIILSITAILPVLRAFPAATSNRSADHTAASQLQLPIKTLLRYALASFLLGIGGGAFLPFQNLFFRQQFGLSDAAVGTVMAWSSLGMGLGAAIGGPTSSKLGLQRAAALLRLGSAPAMLLLLSPVLMPATIGFFFRGFFIAASYPLNDALVIQSTPLQQRGIAVSIMSVLWASGWAVASIVSGWVQVWGGFAPVLVAAAIAYAISSLAIATLRVDVPGKNTAEM